MRGFTIKGPGGPPPDGSIERLSGEELYAAGASHFRVRDYVSAQAYFELYIKKRPADASAYHMLARVYFQQNTGFDRAEECLKKAIEYDPASESRYLETLGALYVHQGRYKLAAELFSYALTKDPKDDLRHTASIAFYLDLAKKKQGRGGAGQEAPPSFLASEMDRWHGKRRQSLFFLPSLLAHAFAIFLIAFLYTHDLPFKTAEETREDFTYVSVEAPQEEAPTGEAAPTEEAAPVEEALPQAEESPVKTAPVTARKEASVSEPKKAAGPAGTQMAKLDTGTSGRRGEVAGKQKAGVGSQAGGDSFKPGQAGGEKGMDLKGASQRKSASSEPEMSRGALGGAAQGGGGGSRSPASVGGLGERGGTAATDAGIFLGGGATGGEKGTGWGKGKNKGLDKGKEPGSGGDTAMPGMKAEKGMDAGIAGGGKRQKGGAGGAPGLFASSGLGIKTEDTKAFGGAGGRGGAGPRQLDRAGGTAQAAQGAAGGMAGSGAGGPEKGAGKGAGSGKIKGSVGVPGDMGVKVQEAGGGGFGDEPGLPDNIGDKRFASAGAGAEGGPSKRGLNISGLSGSDTDKAGAGRGGRGQGGPAGLDRKGGGAALPTPGGGALSQSGGGGTGGYGGGVGRKSTRKSIGGGGSGGGDEGGLLARAGDKLSDIFGIGGGAKGGKGRSDAGISKGGSLSGLGGAGGTGVGAGSGGSGGRKEVRLGGADRTGAGGAGGAPAGRLEADGQRGGLPGGKKMSEGALGVPGGEGEERYASAGRGAARPSQAEKQPGVGRRLSENSLGPKVVITSPRSGTVQQVSQVIAGTVSDQRTKKAILTVNKESRVISVENGLFESVVALDKGRNVVTVTAFDIDGNVGKDSVTLDYEEPTEGAPINITTPKDGQVFDVTEKSTISVKGTMADMELKRAKLILNGNPMDIVVNRGYFDQKVALVTEQATIMVEAVSKDGAISRSPLIKVGTVNVKPKDIMIILTWDKPHADMDLHVYSPAGGHTSYKSPNVYASNEAIVGGQLEQDAKANFGPEVYTQEKADKGVYNIKSNYYYSGGDGNAHASVTVIIYGDNPSRRIVRVFGPHLQVDTKTGADIWDVARLKMPEGIFLEE